MYLFVKRLLDIVAASLLILFFLPLFLPVVLILAFTGEGEIFYLQDRVGYKNRIFKIWKFATMLKNSPNMGTGDITLRNDPRVTNVGRFLRITKLNELPQLWNILNGDMSFVGPRPLMPAGFNDYPEDMKSKIYLVKPGLTGIGSVVFRDEEKIITQSSLPPRDTYRNIIQPYKATLEIWYQSHISLYTDVMILFLTLIKLINSKSAAENLFFTDLPAKIPKGAVQ